MHRGWILYNDLIIIYLQNSVSKSIAFTSSTETQAIGYIILQKSF